MSPADTRTGILRPDLKWAVRRFPLALLAAGFLTLWLLADTFRYSFDREYIALPNEQILFILILAFLVATAAAFATLRLRPWVGLTAQAVGFILGLGVGNITQPAHDTVTLLCLSLVCFISLGAGHAARQGMVGAWLTALSLAANFALCLVALAIILAGGAIVLAAVETLLGFDTEDAYTLLLIVASGLGVPLSWFSLSRFCEDEPAGEQPVNLLHRVVSVVTDGLLIPLILVFAGVIHLYAVRIVLMLELPKGQIGWIVPTYLFSGYGVYLLAHTPGTLLPRLRRVFLRTWIFATPVPLAMLAIAVGLRIDAYGITGDRFLLALIVLGFTLVVASALAQRHLDLRVLPLIGGTLALVAAIGPLSTRNVTFHSQSARVRAIVSSVPPERWAQSRDGGLSERQKENLISAVRELERRGIDLEQAIPQDSWPKGLSRTSHQLAEELNAGVSAASPRYDYVNFDSTEVIRLGSVTLLESFLIDFESMKPKARSSGNLIYTLQINGNILEVSGEGSTTRFDLSTLLTRKNEPAGNAPRPVFQSTEGRKGELVVEYFTRRRSLAKAELRTVKVQIVLY